MIKVKKQHNFLLKPIPLNKLLTRRKIHFLQFFCWISLILIGTFLIGISTNLYSKQFTYCNDQQTFCNRQFTLYDKKNLYIYVVLQNFYQNNRMFLDSYSPLQLQGNVHNNYHCQNYNTYGQLGISINAGGYRVNSSKSIHPCGKVMKNIFNDVVYLITSQGGSIQLDKEDLTSNYNKQYKFKNLQNYQLRQWTDMQSNGFMNYFTVQYTSTKYYLVGKVSLSPDTYQLIIKNNYLQKSVFHKKILITQANGLGIKDPTIGFYLFISGIISVFFHIFLCFKGVK